MFLFLHVRVENIMKGSFSLAKLYKEKYATRSKPNTTSHFSKPTSFSNNLTMNQTLKTTSLPLLLPTPPQHTFPPNQDE